MTTKITLTNIDSTGDYSELVDAAYNTANAASSYANSAYAAANNSTANNSTDTWVRSVANAASSYANSAYTQANTGTTNAATADQRAVTSGVYANAAFAAANTSNGTVTSVVAGTGLAGGTITTTGTISLSNTAVTAGSYTLSNLTVDAQGRITSAANGSLGIIGDASVATVDGTNTVGFRNIPINSQSAAYTAVLSDSGKVIFHPSSDANARTFTIPANGSVAYPVGTALTFINMTAEVVTIAITTDTMYLSSAGTTGSRSLARYGSATAIKIDSTSWLISGSGLT